MEQYHHIKTFTTYPGCSVELIEIPERGLFVLKQYRINEINRWRIIELIRGEITILEQLNRRGFPEFDHQFKDDEMIGFCYRYIPGISLEELVQRGNQYLYSEMMVIDFLREIATLLNYLHSFHPPIIHRDLKPANIIIGEDGKLSIIDFGGAATPHQRGTTMIGTPGFIPPEQLGGRAIPASDLYALGAMVIYLITGISPEGLMEADLKLDYRGKIRFPVSKKLYRLIDQLINPFPEARFQSARELLNSLKKHFPDRWIMIPEKRFQFVTECRFYPDQSSGSLMLPKGTAYLPEEPPDQFDLLINHRNQFPVKILSGPLKGQIGVINTDSDTYRSLMRRTPGERLRDLGISIPIGLSKMIGTALIVMVIIYSLIVYY